MLTALPQNGFYNKQMKPQPQPLIKMPVNQQQAVAQAKVQQPQAAPQVKIQPQVAPQVKMQPQAAPQVKMQPQVAPQVKILPQTGAQQKAAAIPSAQSLVKQEPVSPVTQPPKPATPQIRPAGQQTRPQGAVQMQKLTPQQQQAIKLQQAAKAAQLLAQATKPAPVAKPTTAIPVAKPAPVVVAASVKPPVVVEAFTKEVVPPVQQEEKQQEMDGVIEAEESPSKETVDIKEEEQMVVEMEAAKKKSRWVANRGTFRTSKADKLKRRNARFRKVLQPKNALMILNEMHGSTQYTFVELGMQDNVLKKHAGGFKAATIIDGLEFTGTGLDKVTAKSNAAEAAIKTIILKKILSASAIAKQQAETTAALANLGASVTDGTITAAATATALDSDAAVIADNNGDVEMVDAESVVSAAAAAADDEDAEAEMVPWMHIASFALHKLFNSWEDTGALLRASSQGNLTGDLSEALGGVVGGGDGGDSGAPFNPFATQLQQLGGSAGPAAIQLPQRALPANAAAMHPVMLLNQMRPGVTYYNELEVIGTPPSILYCYECNVEGKGGYIGRGPNKKIARRNASYVACQEVLKLVYSPEILSEIAASSEMRPIVQMPKRAATPRNKPLAMGATIGGGGQGGPGGSGYFVRQSQMHNKLQQQQQQANLGGGALNNQTDLNAGDGYNSGGVDPGYQWY